MMAAERLSQGDAFIWQRLSEPLWASERQRRDIRILKSNFNQNF
jgi:hypothetical protein